MTGWMIALAVGAGLLLLLLLLFFLGTAGVRIRCCGTLEVTVCVFGIPFRIFPKKEKKEPTVKDLSGCRDPEKVLQREEKKRIRKAEKALRKQRKKEEKRLRKERKEERKIPLPTPNLKEKLEMILTVVKAVRHETKGKIRIRAFRLQLRIGAGDAAQTALLYGAVTQASAYLLQWIESNFNHIERKPGEIDISPDFVSGTTAADIDIRFSLRVFRALGILLGSFSAYRKADRRAHRKAALRVRNAARKAESKSEN